MMKLEKDLSKENKILTKNNLAINNIGLNKNNYFNKMHSYEELTSNLDPNHIERLNWFKNKTNKIISWPTHEKFLLATHAKGIFKPAKWKYVLSIRENINSNYPDKKPMVNRYDNSWSYEYYQEGYESNSKLYTNIAMLKNLKDKVPLAVMIQVNKKPSKYEVLGIGLVENFKSSGHFIIKSYT